jgi:HEAT repeat protein
LLSFALESSAAEDDDTFRDVAAEWLSEAWNYSPLLDALLAWVDRLSDKPRSPRLLLLLESILNSHRGESLFGLMQPAVLGSLFELLKRGDENEVWRVRDAAVEVRPSPAIWPVVSRHLRDLKPEARRLAVELVALHRHEEFIPDLMELLGDEDEYVRQEVFVSFGRLGRPSIPFLLRALADQARPTDLRERYLWALANVGYRDGRVSEWIGRCLEEVADDGLLQSALLLAAHLRDRSQKGHAITALANENYRVVQAAVKYLGSGSSMGDMLESAHGYCHLTMSALREPESGA